MQTANITLAIGEDMGNTIPKTAVTPAEVMVLMALHGEAAVFNIDIQADAADEAPRDIILDLYHRYSRAKNNQNEPRVRDVFKDPNSNVPRTFAELGLPESAFTPASLAKMGGAAPEPAEKPLDAMTKAELVDWAAENGVEVDKAAKKSVILAAIEAAGDEDGTDEDATDEDGSGAGALG